MCYDGSLSLAELGIEVCAGDFGLHDGIQVRHDNHVSVEEIAVVCPIQAVTNSRKVLPVDIDRDTALRILSGSVAPIELNRSRGEE